MDKPHSIIHVLDFSYFPLFGKDKTQGPFQRGGTLAYTAPERIDSKQIGSLKLFLNNSTKAQTSQTSVSNNSIMSEQNPSENSFFSNCMSTTPTTGNRLILKNSTNPQTSPTSTSNKSTISKQEQTENSIYSNFMTTESQFGNSYSSKNSISRTNPTKSVIDGTILGIFKERKYWLLSI